MQQDIERILRQKESAEADLLALPGVTGVDVGYKYIDGQMTDDLVIRVFVEEKRDVPPEQLIAKTINGVDTDVIEHRFVPLVDHGSYNPILGGVSVGPFRPVDGLNCGTLGAIVIDNQTAQRMILSNYHVLCINEGWHDHEWGHFREITQPAIMDNPVSARYIAEIQRGILDSEIDAAVARVEESIYVDYLCEVEEIGPITGVETAVWGMKVHKRGRTSGLTHGRVSGLNGTFKVPFEHGVGTVTLTHQISIARQDGAGIDFAEQGDSGSVIVNDAGRVVGLLFCSGYDGGAGANFIERVLDRINVSMAIEGIGGYDVLEPADHAFSYEFAPAATAAKQDHLVWYRPGRGALFIVKKDGPGQDGIPWFSARYKQGAGGSGIGGYDLSSTADRIFALDLADTGADHLVLYRPGTGAVFIVKPDGAETDGTPKFKPIYQRSGGGIGGYDLASTADQAFAYDFASSGKLDHLVLYRPGEGAIFIVKHDGTEADGTTPKFKAIYQQSHGGVGIGGYDLTSTADRIFPFDGAGTGLDHLVLYRPGKGAIFIVTKDGTDEKGIPKFKAVYQQGVGGTGIGGYDLTSAADRAFAFDFDGIGKLDHLVFYRPGRGAIFIIKQDGREANGTPRFKAIFQQGDGGTGIGGYDLSSSDDRIFPFDYAGTGHRDHLVLYRPGKGIVWILEKNGTETDGTPKFAAVYKATK